MMMRMLHIGAFTLMPCALHYMWSAPHINMCVCLEILHKAASDNCTATNLAYSLFWNLIVFY